MVEEGGNELHGTQEPRCLIQAPPKNTAGIRPDATYQMDDWVRNRLLDIKEVTDQEGL